MEILDKIYLILYSEASFEDDWIKGFRATEKEAKEIVNELNKDLDKNKKHRGWHSFEEIEKNQI